MSVFQAALARIETLLVTENAGCCRFIMKSDDKHIAQTINDIDIEFCSSYLSSEKYLTIIPKRTGCMVLTTQS